VLKKIFGCKMGEVRGKFIILHNKELCDISRSPSVLKIVGSCVRKRVEY
jgi:hypothetical protein